MSAHELINNIKAQQDNITALYKILKDMDPASGVTIAVRGGVARDNPDAEDDAERRPWVTVEMSDLELATKAIEAAIEAAKSSLATRIRFARRDHKVLTDFLSAHDRCNSSEKV